MQNCDLGSSAPPISGEANAVGGARRHQADKQKQKKRKLSELLRGSLVFQRAHFVVSYKDPVLQPAHPASSAG
jgi:hypothetical protein